MIRLSRPLSVLFQLAFAIGAYLVVACGGDETTPSPQVDVEHDGQADMERDAFLDAEIDLEETLAVQSTFGTVAGGGIAAGDSYQCRLTIGDWPASLAQSENYRVRIGVAAVVNP